MERTKVRESRGDEPPGKSGLNLTMTWLSKSGKGDEQAAQGGQSNGGAPKGKPADNDEGKRYEEALKDGKKPSGEEEDYSRFTRSQFPVKQEF